MFLRRWLRRALQRRASSSMELGNSTVIRVPTKLNYTFFRYWVEFLAPIHKLSRRDADVFASLLFERYKLSQAVTDSKLIGSLLTSSEVRKEICDFQGMTGPHLNTCLGALRKQGVFVDNDINPKFIPIFSKGKDDYKLIIHFNLHEDK